tara:strand:- start:3235 stop:3429 length:195 start_codon:yes stop_codon:yes gene_type:complete
MHECANGRSNENPTANVRASGRYDEILLHGAHNRHVGVVAEVKAFVHWLPGTGDGTKISRVYSV